MKKYITNSVLGVVALAIIYSIVYSVLYISDPEAVTAIVTITVLTSIVFFAARSINKIRDKQTVR